MYRDTKYFTLRLLGRNTKLVPAVGTAFLVSASSSIAEELFFRGFMLQYFNDLFHNPFLALVLNAGIFGFSHFPVLGANAVVEAILGGAFGFSYIYSGYNLAVPIALHGMYDFGTIILTWITASSDLRQRLIKAKEIEMADLAAKDPYQINAISRMVFSCIDTNSDGYIDEKELMFGLQAFRYIAVEHMYDTDAITDVLTHVLHLFMTLTVSCQIAHRSVSS
jgi:Type II CAAX prenyl endopeptidase Rce1-like